MNVTIRQAVQEELEWVNEQYRKVQFQPSIFEQEVIAIVEVEGERVGLGRLVNIDEQNLELGGMYVIEKCRGYGLARNLITYLLHHAEQKMVYCLPFEHLQQFYMGCGFEPVTDKSNVPDKVIEKWEWCQQTYPEPTLLLQQQV